MLALGHDGFGSQWLVLRVYEQRVWVPVVIRYRGQENAARDVLLIFYGLYNRPGGNPNKWELGRNLAEATVKESLVSP